MQPFTWLARTHLLSAAGDALIAIALAGSLFFNLDPAAARPRVALYLLVTMAPFAVVGPLIGPMVDRARGGRRGMIIGAGIARAILALLMVWHLDSLLLFPEAFGALVAGKTYHVAKSAVVPGLVRQERDLVEANSKLMLLSGLGGALAAGPGVLLSLASSRWVLMLAAMTFVLMTFPAARLPRFAVRPRHVPSGAHGSPPSANSPPASLAIPQPARVRATIRRGAMLLAGSAMGIVRAMTGFTLFLIAFWLRADDAAPWWFGFMFTASAAGQLIGAVGAPWLRRRVREEVLLACTLLLAAAMSFYVVTAPDRGPVLGLALVIGFMSALGKLCFDAIVQRDEAPADQGRTFARFETRFQLMWVIGGLVPVTAPSGILPLRAGVLLLAVAATVAVVLYAGGLWALARGRRPPSVIIAARVRTRITQTRARRQRRS
ncbi:MFS transporter [Candidatus Poriferisodalis sp.]|uniref:MFS transporter n=1 Tax=Candidatus Poriferisodalis sp. TaxID=3101277 RepID=UPI003B0128B6